MMANRKWSLRAVQLAGAAALTATGCMYRTPPVGYLPDASSGFDARTAALLAPGSAPKMTPPVPPGGEPGKVPRAFELPPGFPGTEVPPLRPPKLTKDTPPADRLKLVREAYPEAVPVGSIEAPGGAPLTLADLQQTARANSPVLKRASADVGVAYGQMIQAGLHPNPTLGYEADQVTPGPHAPANNAGQQGAFVNQLIKFPGKLSLAQAVARFDYINAYVAVRKSEMDVSTAVRSSYFQVQLARKGIEVNTALVAMADEVYQLQLRQVAAGEAAGYEPLQLYAQAVQARNALALAKANYRANWRQLAAALGQPDLAPAALTGSVDLPPPVIDAAAARVRIAEAHTDILTARNRLLQAQTNLRLQRLNRVPDIATNLVVQYDNLARLNQFNLQVGLPMPVFDRNQGNIRSAEFQIASNTAALTATENDLVSRLADALGRYESNRVAAANLREKVLPALTQVYQGVIRRYQQEPDDVPRGKISFNDIVVAQQNLVQALQNYLTALTGQWQAVVDVGNLLQSDELYFTPPGPRPEASEKK
ncbi:TolC family protein [Gemmata sp. G18]|uniref:TolC family protein n=1 Tax=Gemmata palustris TaxID=2822762 RepID=A0ABS5BUG3_9BACT|nr:TolC family protein [Gemmata palustris]MBP3956518.1 TolC family protein [Gemmata palustris]